LVPFLPEEREDRGDWVFVRTGTALTYATFGECRKRGVAGERVVVVVAGSNGRASEGVDHQ